MLGVAAIVALLGFLAYAANTAALMSYRDSGRLRWRLAATNLAHGGLATAHARLAENPQWTGEAWSQPGIGDVQIHVVPRTDSSSLDVVIRASAPDGDRPQQQLVLSARYTPSSASIPETMEILGWADPSAPLPGEAAP